MQRVVIHRRRQPVVQQCIQRNRLLKSWLAKVAEKRATAMLARQSKRGRGRKKKQ